MTPLFAFLNHINGPEIFIVGGVLLLFFGNRLPGRNRDPAANRDGRLRIHPGHRLEGG